eukprot:1177023-Prorocentrum_minimum.AAC.3
MDHLPGGDAVHHVQRERLDRGRGERGAHGGKGAGHFAAITSQQLRDEVHARVSTAWSTGKNS